MKSPLPLAVILLVTTIPQLTGCIARRERLVPPQLLAPAAPPPGFQPQLVGVTTSGDSDVTFDGIPAAVMSGDTIHAYRRGSPYTVDLAHVGAMWMALPGLVPVSVPPSDLSRAAAMMEPIHGDVLGIATTSGTTVQFTSGRPAAIAHDTLYATALGAAYKIPLAQVRGVRVVQTSVGRSLLKSFGLAALVTAGLSLVVLVGWIIDPPAMM